MVASASGKRMLTPEKPSSLALMAWIQNPSGGLSIVTKPTESRELKKNACRFCVILKTAAA
jgi:hypothetical protein